ncbi:discoidin domain-containing protein, partial [bacterium]|nr:discoidin domain-containing protein [bacterium]
HLTRAEGPAGKPALRLDYDFHGSGGFVVARKEVQFLLPKTFDIRFWLHGEGLPNHLEFKIADPSGANAWRFLKENVQLPADWREVRIRERDLPFAWGPAGGGGPGVVGAIELAIAAGEGGVGTVWFSDLSLEDQTLFAPASVEASSHLPNNPPESVFEASAPSGWQAEPGDPAPYWSVDFGRLVRFGGLAINWPVPMGPRAYEIEISADGESWSRIYQASRALGARSHVSAAKAEARFLRLKFANAESAALVSLHLRPDAFSHTPNEFIHAVAADYPRGWFPRYWSREQSYWTPVGSPEGRRRGLINEEGLVEVDEAGFSLEPFLLIGDRLVTWADVEIGLALSADGSPFPVVTWQAGEVKLWVLPWVDGTGDELTLRVTYRVEYDSTHEIRLAVTVLPFQVNPPWQAFRNLGGRSPIREIVCDERGLHVDGRRVSANRPPDRNGAVAFEEGGVVDFLARGEFPAAAAVDDESGLASAAMVWNLPAGDAPFEVTISVPFFQETADPAAGSRETAIRHWCEVLAPIEWRVPSLASSAIECFRTAASHILINRDGPAIQPGPRRYTRSWVRDCVIMGAAMAKVDRPHVLRDFLLWYVQFQHEDGYVPCVVDRDGVDALVENDSHGQLLWGICEAYRNEGSREFLEQMWQPVQRTADYLLRLRAQRMTLEFSEPERSDRYGLLPESASHEGYLAHPVHSYWDDFWGIRGLEAAAELADAMNRPEEAARWRNEAGAFLGDVLVSIDRVIAEHQLAYIPGSVEWADFDPTATSNAIAQLDFADALPAVPLHQMLETYLTGFRQKHRGEIPWLNYTAYEIRIIGALVRLGKREEAHELLDVFLADRRPREWNQWPEITWRDPRSPGHLGDVPHTWIAAEYMLALVSMVASEREASEKLVLASGLPWEWISQEQGFSVRGLMTRFGRLEFQMDVPETLCIRFEIGASLT